MGRELNTHKRSRVGAAALVTAASLLLTACGADSKSDSERGIDGAQQSSSSTSSPPSATPKDDGVDRPEITLPKDVDNTFEPKKTGDPKKDAVLADNERSINSIDEIITSGDTKRPGLRFYSKGTALESALTYIQSFFDAGVTFTGTTRYYNREVTFLKSGGAVVTYCSDETKAYSENRKTGEVRKTPGSPDDYTFYNARMEKNSAGVWQSANVISNEAAKKCQP